MTTTQSHGLVYRWVWGYRALMRLLYREGYTSKYQAVADVVPAGSTVVDLCAGDCALAPLVRAKGCRYTALDINAGFVEWAKSNGVDARIWSGQDDPIPTGDVVCMQSSLYHFMDDDLAMLQRMVSAARRMVIISEPVHNVSTGSSTVGRALARRLTAVSGREFSERYSAEKLHALMQKVRGAQPRLIGKGRDALYVLEKDEVL